MDWRNLCRNRRRTLITASALAFGYLASDPMIGLLGGMVSEMVTVMVHMSVSGAVFVAVATTVFTPSGNWNVRFAGPLSVRPLIIGHDSRLSWAKRSKG